MRRILFFLILSLTSVNAQVSIDTIHAQIGQHVKLSITISNYSFQSLNKIVFNVELSNPTVFYPDSVTCELPEKQLRLHNIGYGHYEVSISNIKREYITDGLVIIIHGEMLAGYDSVCHVVFPVFKINDDNFSGLKTVAYSQSLGTPLPYIRRSVLSINSPNPVTAGNSTEWGFRTDAPTEVTFLIYELSGRMLDKVEYGIAQPGIHKFIFTPAQTFAAGTYLITMITPVSLHTQFFTVIK